MTHSLSNARANKKNLAIVFALTTGFMLIEAVAGYLTQSLALLADAGHMLTDAGALGLALLALWFGERPATAKNTYGFYRIEILAAFINALVLLLISFYILFEAWQRFEHPPEVQSLPMLVVACAGLGVNLVGLKLLHAHAHHNLNMKGAYLEVLSDMLGSIGVIAASIIMLTTGWYYADPLVSAGIGLFILPRTWKLLNEAVHILLEGTPARINLSELEEALKKIDGVKAIHDLHVWTITSGVDALSAHMLVDEGKDNDTTLTRLRDVLEKRFQIHHSTIQLETGSCTGPGCDTRKV